MAKFISLSEGAVCLETTRSCIMVTAFDHKKKHGEYPCWYKSDGKIGGRKSYVDIDYILQLREKEKELHHLACDLFYFIIEEMKIKQSHLAPMLASKSEIYNKHKSWMSFLQVTLFCEPLIKFNVRVTRLQEFYRIGTDIVKEYKEGLSNGKR